MNTSARSEVARFEARMQKMRDEQGLSDFKFYPGAVSEASPEDFAREANLMLDSIEAGEFKTFRFNDSRRSK